MRAKPEKSGRANRHYKLDFSQNGQKNLLTVRCEKFNPLLNHGSRHCRDTQIRQSFALFVFPRPRVTVVNDNIGFGLSGLGGE